MGNKKVVISILTFLCMLTLIFCSACSNSSKFDGDYHVKRIFYSGKVYDIGDTFNGKALTNDYITAKVRSDNSLIVSYTYSNIRAEQRGIWHRYDEYTYTCYVDDITSNAFVNGKTAVISVDGMVIVFEK